MTEIKDYGEPWAYNKDRTPSLDTTRPAYQDRDGKTIPGKSTYADDGAVRDRALACMNALAGRDPEKLKALEEAVEAAVEGCDMPGCDCEKLRVALRAFRGEVHDD